MIIAAILLAVSVATRKWQITVESHIEGVPDHTHTQVMCVTADEVAKRREALKSKPPASDCTLFDRTSQQTADSIHMSYRYSCKDKDASGKTETTIETDFSETTTRGVMHGKSVFMHSTMKRLGDCD